MDNFVADGIYVDTAPETVFQRLLTPEDVLVWTESKEATIGASTGGQYDLRRFDGVQISGTLGRIESPALIQISDYFWEKDGRRRGPMTLTISLEPRGEGVWVLHRLDNIDDGDDWKRFAVAIRKELQRNSLLLKRHIDEI